MIVAICEVFIRCENYNSIKEKRSEVKRITERAKNKFNISIAEVDSQDNKREIVIGFSAVSNEKRHIDSVIQNVINFIENNTTGDIFDVIKEIL